MPRYYFDLDNGTTPYRDAEGLEFSGATAACAAMRRTLLEVAKEEITSDTAKRLAGTVRDRDGVIWRAQLRFEVGPAARGSQKHVGGGKQLTRYVRRILAPAKVTEGNSLKASR